MQLRTVQTVPDQYSNKGMTSSLLLLCFTCKIPRTGLPILPMHKVHKYRLFRLQSHKLKQISKAFKPSKLFHLISRRKVLGIFKEYVRSHSSR